MSAPTYPGDRSNHPEDNNQPFRDLAVINQPAGAIEFINTKDDEMVILSHKNGSFVKMNKVSNDTLNVHDKREVTQGDDFTEVHGNKVEVIDKDFDNVVYGNRLQKTGDVDKWQKFQEKIKAALRPIHNLKRLFEIKRTVNHNAIDQAPAQTMAGSFASNPASQIQTKTLKTTSTSTYTAGTKEAGNHTVYTIQNNQDTYEISSSSDGWGDFTSWGTGISPSTQDGNWTKDTQKDKIKDQHIQIQETILEYEKELGQNKHPDGGTVVDKISKDSVVVVGLAFNDFESFRKDPAGKLVPYGVKIDPLGNSVYVQYREAGLVETVAVDSLPGGKYHLTAGEEIKLIAGSNGIDIKTSGTIEQYGSTITTTTESFTLNSSTDVSIGAEQFDVSADIITLRPNKVSREILDTSGAARNLPVNGKTVTEPEQQVLIDGNLNIALNAVVAGGLHVEGEVTLHHITAPLEYQITNECFEWGKQSSCELDSTNSASCSSGEPPKSPVYVDILSGCEIGVNKYDVIGFCSDGATCTIPARTIIIESTLAANAAMCHNHMHSFANIPLKLIRDNVDAQVTVGSTSKTESLDPHSIVRAVGARNNFAVRTLALPVQNSTTPETVVEKFTGNQCEPFIISGGDWNEPNVDETLPSGNGIRTRENELDALIAKAQAWNDKLEKQYIILQNKLDVLSN